VRIAYYNARRITQDARRNMLTYTVEFCKLFRKKTLPEYK